MKSLVRSLSAMLAVLFVVGGAAQVRADVVYSDNFTNGIDFTANDPYWLNQNLANGFITATTNTTAIWPGDPNEFTTAINSGVGGSGNFLFNGTYYYGGNEFDIPAGHEQFYISSSFSVSTSTEYQVSFYLTNANTISVAQIQPDINGTLLGSAVSAVGTWGTNGWQQFTFTWNSGSATSAALTLHDFQLLTEGNDFGIADIVVQSVQSVPEPSTFGAAILGALGMISYARLRRRAPEPGTRIAHRQE
jgi:hypothetical protein